MHPDNDRIPYYIDDSYLAEIIFRLLEDRKKYLLDVDFEENPAEKQLFDKLVGSFYEHYTKRIKEKDFAYVPVEEYEKCNLVSMLFMLMQKKIELYERELVVAEDIQRNLIPDKVPKINGYDLAAYYHPCKHIGGDYYDFYQISHNRLYFVVGDVAGHGIPSSLIVSSMQAFIYSQIQEEKSLHALIGNLNEYLIKTLITGRYTTLFIGSLAVNTGALNYINAGHNPPIIVRKNGEIEKLTKGGPLVGMIDGISYISGYTELQDGDLLAIMTDGVVEAMNEKDEEFSEERFIEIVKNEFDKPLLGIMLKLFNELRKHCNGVPYADDITLLFLKKLMKEN